MLLGMAADMPELIEEVYVWKAKSYAEHFADSSLAFAALAIELYRLAPTARRKRLEGLIELMSWTVYEAKDELRLLLETERLKEFAERAKEYSEMLQRLVDFGSAIVHGRAGATEQASIDELFD
jgi:plasmid replication initiation protein